MLGIIQSMVLKPTFVPTAISKPRKDIDHPFIMTQVNTFETKKSAGGPGFSMKRGPWPHAQVAKCYRKEGSVTEVYILTELITGGELHGLLDAHMSTYMCAYAGMYACMFALCLCSCTRYVYMRRMSYHWSSIHLLTLQHGKLDSQVPSERYQLYSPGPRQRSD